MVDHAPTAVLQREHVRRGQVCRPVATCLVAGDDGGLAGQVHNGAIATQLEPGRPAENLQPAVEHDRAPAERSSPRMKAGYRRALRPEITHRGVVAGRECSVEGRVGGQHCRLGRAMGRFGHGVWEVRA